MTKVQQDILALAEADNPGAELRRMRERAGISQAELGVWLGVSPSTITRWERGIGEPSITQARRIADILGRRGPIPGFLNSPLDVGDRQPLGLLAGVS